MNLNFAILLAAAIAVSFLVFGNFKKESNGFHKPYEPACPLAERAGPA